MTRLGTVIGGGLAVALLSLLGSGEPPGTDGERARARILEGYGRMPLRFEPSAGPAARPARYVSRGPGYTVSLTPSEMVLSLRKADARGTGRGPLRPEEARPGSAAAAVLRVTLLRARSQAEVQGLDELPGKSNYFIGRDPKKWRTNVPGYAKVRYRGVYPGIDLLYYGKGRELEYDFVVAPGSDPSRIRMGFEGARGLRVDGEGNLVVALEGGVVVKRAPRVYQEEGARKEAVRARWLLRGTGEAGFEVGAYDPRRVLVIDPVLSYSTYLGGSSDDRAFAIAVDGSGAAYVTGLTYSTDFPTVTPFQTDGPLGDVFVTKLSPSGDVVLYSTYLGGNSNDLVRGIAVDSEGSAYVTGNTGSTDFPTLNPFQPTYVGIGGDAFVTKLSPLGDSLVYSTYLGGSNGDGAFGIAVNSAGEAYVTGFTFSSNFPTLSPLQTYQGSGDAFVTRLSPFGGSLFFSTYLGGSGSDVARGIAVDSQGHAYVTGYTGSTNFPLLSPYQTDQPGTDAFVTRLAPNVPPVPPAADYSTYLGGSGDDFGYGIAVNSVGNAYVTGATRSPNFPTQNPYQTDQGFEDAFVTKLQPSGDSLVYSTYLGGGHIDTGYGIAVDSSGSAHVTGETLSLDFPTVDPYQTDQPVWDAFVTKLSAAGNSLVSSTYLGGSGDDAGYGIAVNSPGTAYVTGETPSTDFPTLNPYQADQPLVDAFVAKVSHAGLPMDFHTVSPCRVIDTRDAAGPYGGPALAAGADRTFVLAGRCGISLTARAVSVNVAVTAPTAAGNLRLYPAAAPLPLVSSINYGAGQSRSNNAIISLSSGGAIAVRCAQASGTAHLILDVNGYFE